MESILVVDDDPSNGELIATIVSNLTKGEYNILRAENGEEGLRLFEEHFPVLVITDFKMPKMTGEDLISRIKSKNLPVKTILVSGSEDIEEAAKKVGADDFVKKPMLTGLKEKISRLLEETKQPLAKTK